MIFKKSILDHFQEIKYFLNQGLGGGGTRNLVVQPLKNDFFLCVCYLRKDTHNFFFFSVRTTKFWVKNYEKNMNHSGLGGGYPDLSGSTTKFFFLCESSLRNMKKSSNYLNNLRYSPFHKTLPKPS